VVLRSIGTNIAMTRHLEIREIDGSKFLEAVGLDRAISSQRTNGFSSAINKIQKDMLD